MGGRISVPKVSFEDMQTYCTGSVSRGTMIISTMPDNLQSCLLPSTIPSKGEEDIINRLAKGGTNTRIVVYGTNCNDDSVYTKHQQLTSFGFTSVLIYPGGMFEWLCLQDIYGRDNFPTTQEELDILKYKPTRRDGLPMIEDKHP